MGGVIGSEYARKACRAGVHCLVVLAISEGHAATIAAVEHADKRAAWHGGLIRIAAETLTFSVMDIAAEPGTESPIAINLPSSAELRAAGAETGTYLLIRNIPEGVSISPGMATRRVRVVPLRDVSTLRLISEPGVNTRFQLEFLLIDRHNRVLTQATATVHLRKNEPLAASVTTHKMQAPTASVQPKPQARPLTPQAEVLMLARGQDILKQGSIAAARLIFEELAALGSAAGAFALAQSYDPAHLAPAEAPAPPPNLEEARKWYERAAELGNLDAKSRLAEINSGR